MSSIANRSVGDQIIDCGNSYGGARFWIEVLREDSNPSSIWKALLYIAFRDIRGQQTFIISKLHHPNSRARAWAAFAVGHLHIRRGLPRLLSLMIDPSPRVRFRAREALNKLKDSNGMHGMHYVPPRHMPTILISEDSAYAQGQLTQMLGTMGCLACAPTTNDTIRLARAIKPKLIITDNQKDRDNLAGLRMTRQLAEDRSLEECVLIMRSADPFEGLFLWEGGDYFFWKGSPSLRRMPTVVGEFLGRFHEPQDAHGKTA